MAGSCRPTVSCRLAKELAFRHFALDTSCSPLDAIKELASFEDRNFFMRGHLPADDGPADFVLKVLHHKKSAQTDGVLARCEVVLHLEKHGFSCPVPVRTLSGQLAEFLRLPSYTDSARDEGVIAEKGCSSGETMRDVAEGVAADRRHAVCLLRFVPGVMAKDSRMAGSPQILDEIGRYVARMNKCLLVSFSFANFLTIFSEPSATVQCPFTLRRTPCDQEMSLLYT